MWRGLLVDTDASDRAVQRAKIEERRRELEDRAAEVGGNVQPMTEAVVLEGVRRMVESTATVADLRPFAQRIAISPYGVATIEALGRRDELPLDRGADWPMRGWAKKHQPQRGRLMSRGKAKRG